MIFIILTNAVTIPGNVAIAILAAIGVFVWLMLWGKAKEGTMYYKVMMAGAVLFIWSGLFAIIKAIWPVE